MPIQCIGRYEIESLAGEGATAVVYRARDPDIGRTVAIKVLKKEAAADQDYLSRFQREAQSAGTISHPNIVTIYDVGRVGDTPYITMEYLDEKSLKDLLASGKKFPDGVKMAKIHWAPKPNEFFPTATVPGKLVNVDFMVKDSKRFADSGGWGYAVFDYDAASDTFKPGTLAGTPPQGNDAKCGFVCHTTAKNRDYVFTDYGRR